MSLWSEGKYRGGERDACFGPGEKEDIAYARQLCCSNGIPYHLFDCSEKYEQMILTDFRREYLAGRTPNPCVRCNAQMKFGLLPALAKEPGVEFDVFATGHYARLDQSGERPRLLRARDSGKDQSYFLYRLTPEQLRKSCFPLGKMTKTEVRCGEIPAGRLPEAGQSGFLQRRPCRTAECSTAPRRDCRPDGTAARDASGILALYHWSAPGARYCGENPALRDCDQCLPQRNCRFGNMSAASFPDGN